ncbi:MAG: polyprenyl synthetase family protein [Acidobacteria bacterium]|nr:polyprenyl synthetase family protein [Acidobacteriota bacterium]MBV9475864.1 polyprenyl synthetase family protein [Acidobacteriota bacterium]
MELKDYLASRRTLIDETLAANLPPADTHPPLIHEAMRYAILGGGKRVRPILAIAAAEAVGADVAPLLVHLCALELIHTYSLVHDDLPALDDDDLRRGRKTTHVVFGEAIGILAGDALLTEAFSWLARPLANVDAARQLRAIADVARAVDSTGMIGGQVADLVAERWEHAPKDRDSLLRELDFIHRNKTGKLLTASVLLGGVLGGASDAQLDALKRYADALGLAFQIVDDLLDIEESSAVLGKTAGKDVAQGKLTWPALLGADHARAEVGRLLAEALENGDRIAGPVNYLGAIARYICERRS